MTVVWTEDDDVDLTPEERRVSARLLGAEQGPWRHERRRWRDIARGLVSVLALVAGAWLAAVVVRWCGR